MSIGIYEIAGLVLLFLLGIKMMGSPLTAVRGNGLSALGMLLAVVLVLWRSGIMNWQAVALALAVGTVGGVLLALRVSMIKMPQMVGLLNGLGGAASALVALAVLFDRYRELDLVNRLAGQLALVVGAVTFSGSLIASGKLERVIPQRPIGFRGEGALNLAVLILLAAGAATGVAAATGPALAASLAVTALSLYLGVVFALRIGGADMPVAISLLNSCSGLAAAICGFVVADPLLVAVGAIVGASGLLLTRIMCRAMNRSLAAVLAGRTTAGDARAAEDPEAVPAAAGEASRDADPAAILARARRVTIVPGYGMALAQAQAQVKAVYDCLTERGREVKFAIHPVAGRMPGHMNVLLAEVEIPYDRLVEMDEINPEFASTDVALIVGACDVVNPAAMTAEGTPLYGMPVLRADEAAAVIICNRDRMPGYSGVPNPLYDRPNAIFLAGDAAETLATLLAGIKELQPSV